MTYIDTRPAFECLRNMAKGLFLESEKKIRRQVIYHLDCLLEPSKYAPEKPNGYVPIRSSWPRSVTKRERKSDSFFKRQSKATVKPAKLPKVPQTAQQILDSL